jgi:hypothetical protein
MERDGGKNVSGGALGMSREIVESAAPARLRVVTLRDVNVVSFPRKRESRAPVRAA